MRHREADPGRASAAVPDAPYDARGECGRIMHIEVVMPDRAARVNLAYQQTLQQQHGVPHIEIAAEHILQRHTAAPRLDVEFVQRAIELAAFAADVDCHAVEGAAVD